MTRILRSVLCTFACAALLIPSVARAHHDPISSLTVTIEPRVIRLAMVVPADELALWSPPAPSHSPEEYAAAVAGKLQDEASDLFELRADYNVLSPSDARGSAPDPQTVRLEMEFPPPDGGAVASLQVFSNLVPKLSQNHQQVVCVQDARPASTTGGPPRVVAWLTLTPRRFTAFADVGSTATTAPATTSAAAATATAPSGPDDADAAPASFFRLGVKHILTGYDHLLFLAALLLVCGTFREAATIITCFTAAHSVTLALAALDVVRLPSRAVEAVVAASIVYVAIENIHTSGRGRARLAWRAAVTCAFGLVHGLGFASVLRELGLGSTPAGVVMPLLKFNLGVETGQLAVAAVVFPLILAARRGGPALEHYFVPSCSAVVAAAGAYWLVERVAFT